MSADTSLVSANTSIVSADTSLVSTNTSLVSADTSLISADTSLFPNWLTLVSFRGALPKAIEFFYVLLAACKGACGEEGSERVLLASLTGACKVGDTDVMKVEGCIALRVSCVSQDTPFPGEPMHLTSTSPLTPPLHAVSPIGALDGPPSISTGSALKFSVELTPVTCDADLGFAQVTLAAQGGQLPSPTKQLDFDSALDFYTPAGAEGTPRSLGLQLIKSLATDASSECSQSIACALHFMDEDDLVTSADETVSMGSTDTDSSLY